MSSETLENEEQVANAIRGSDYVLANDGNVVNGCGGAGSICTWGQ